MKEKVKRLPARLKKRIQTALLLFCAAATFVVPAFGGGYSVLKEPQITSSASAIEDVDLLLVAASAYGEAKKAMNATDNELKDTFVANTAALVSFKWPNIGLLVGARDSLSGSTWTSYQSPITLSASEVATYGSSELADAYNKYKAFGYAVQNMNKQAQKSSTTAVSAEEGLDAMSAAAIKLGSFGVEFLNDYNPGPVLLALYDSSYLGRYASNKLVQIVRGNEVLYNIVCFFGDPVVNVGGWNMSMFVMLNAVLAVAGMALWMLFKVLMGNGTIGDGIVRFMSKILIGTVGIFVIANFMSWMLGWVTDTIYEVDGSEDTRYVEDNLNIYDWYMTGFQLPSGISLQIDSLGNFVFNPDTVYAINHYTYNRLVGGGDDTAIRARMETLTQSGNTGTASFVSPSSTNADGEGTAWATDVYYAIMKNYAENKDDLMDGNDDESSPLYGMTSFSIYRSKFLWMSSLTMSGAPNSGWQVTGNGSDTYYGLNPISAFNLIRSDFSGETITSSSVVYPPIAYVGFDINDTFVGSAPAHMNSLTRFIACFTLTLAALKGLVTIFTAGFGGLISGGVKTATGSAHGLGQALGAVVALLGGVIGISLIMSMTLALLDTVYGIAVSLVGNTEVLDGFLGPIIDTVGEIPVIGGPLKKAFRSVVEGILLLVLALTFPKMGGIPITVFSQAMADLPGRIGERAQMIEAQLFSGRSAAGGGLPPRGGSGQYGRMASGMMGNAFSSGAKQAGRIIGAGAAAAGSLAGAGLSTLGRSLNDRADAAEGKGVMNPGGFSDEMWDKMSDEQKNDAAEFAASQENWENMSDSERREAMEQQGFYENTSSTESTTYTSSSTMQEDGSQYSAEDNTAAEQVSGSIDDPDATSVPEVGEGQSISAQTPNAPGMPSAPEIPSGNDMRSVAAESMASAVSEDASVAGTDGMNGLDGNSSGNGNTVEQNTNTSQESLSQDVKQNSEVNLDQDTNAENHMVDASLNAQQGDISNIESAAADHASNAQGLPSGGTGLNTGMAAAGTTAAAQTAASAGSRQSSGNGLPTSSNSGQRNSNAAQQSGAGATYRSVSQNTQVGGNAMQQSNVSASQNVQANSTQVSQNSSNSSMSSVSSMSSSQQTANNPSGTMGQSLTPGNSQAVRDADQGEAKQGMNGMSRGKYGKMMTVEEQKKARLQHAAGDALQMMGGNRTIGEGVGDALSYAKDAALIAATPDELQSSEFMNGIRMRRMERMQRQQMRRDRK